MPFNRRHFLKQISAISIGSVFNAQSFAKDLQYFDSKFIDADSNTIAQDEEYWQWVRSNYTINPSLINLNNGGVSPQPKSVQDAFKRYCDLCNEGPSFFMWRTLDTGREPLRQRIADVAGCLSEEIAIHRNTTEALANIVFGIELQPGDEVVLTHQDYPNMVHAWKQRELRQKIKLVWLNLDLPIDDDDAITKTFTQAFTSKTKVVHITHVMNWTGQILPVRKIADEAKKRGIQVVVDGAHSFAQLDFRIDELNCDYFGTSLHKWMGAPFGTGFMYVRKEKISSLFSLMPNDKPNGDDIRKFEALGTRNFAAEQAIMTAIDFHEAIGIKRKQARLLYLKNYWTQKVKHLPQLKFNTTLNDKYSNAITNVIMDGMSAQEMEAFLYDKYKIHTSSVNWANIHGLRITPSVYTSLNELDKLVHGFELMAEKINVKK